MKLAYSRIYTLLISSCIILGLTTLVAQEVGSLQFSVLPQSSIGIAGSSNINKFYCESIEVGGTGHTTISNDSVRIEDYFGRVYIAAKSMDCRSGRMNKDMYKALRADEFPAIDFTLVNVSEAVQVEDSNQWIIATEGLMSAAGATVQIDIDFLVNQVSENTFRLSGSRDVFMSEFNIEPPTALLGLIKARNAMEIRFDLMVQVEAIGL